MIAIDLSKHQVLDADLRAIPQIHFKANLDRDTTMEIQQCSLLLKKQKKLFWIFHKEP